MKIPHDHGDGLGHQKHREFLDIWHSYKDTVRILSIPTVQPDFV